MKIPSIFWKNLRTVSRNPNYFIILIVCPILLILLAGFVLNSINFNNIKIGVVREPGVSELKIDNLRGISYYDNTESCISALTEAKINACFDIKNESGENKIEVYLDTTRKVIEYYARQYITQNIMDQQKSLFEKASGDLGTKISFLVSSLNESKQEIDNTQIELDHEQKIVTEYRRNLSIMRQDFEEMYVQLKSFDNNFSQYKSLANSSNNISSSISDFRNRKSQIDIQIAALRFFLSTRLSPPDYNRANTYLQNITDNLDSIDRDLRTIQTFTDQNNINNFLDAYEKALAEIEKMRVTLGEVDTELANTQTMITQSQQRLEVFKTKLEQGQAEMMSLNNLDSSIIGLEFKSPFKISEDPIALSFPLLITMIIAFSSIVLTNMFIIRKVNQPSYLRDIITPTSRFTLMIGDYLINLFFISIQIVALFFIGTYWFGFSNLLAHPGLFFGSLILAASIFIFIGMIIGYLVRSPGISVVISLFSVLVFIILSDLLAPATLASDATRMIIELNPFYLLEQILYNFMLLGQEASKFRSIFIRLSIFLVIGVIAAYLAKFISEKQAMKDF